MPSLAHSSHYRPATNYYLHRLLYYCIIGENEYCQWETFNATCTGEDKTISITSARYGRMRVGRCLPVNHMIGCVADVTDLVKSRCDGKTSCAISLPDTQLHHRNTCPRHLSAYLEVDYRCVEGKSGSLHVDFLCRDNRLTFDITIAYRYGRCTVWCIGPRFTS